MPATWKDVAERRSSNENPAGRRRVTGIADRIERVAGTLGGAAPSLVLLLSGWWPRLTVPSLGTVNFSHVGISRSRHFEMARSFERRFEKIGVRRAQEWSVLSARPYFPARPEENFTRCGLSSARCVPFAPAHGSRRERLLFADRATNGRSRRFSLSPSLSLSLSRDYD